MPTNIKCRNCPGIRYKGCSSPNILTNGKLCCEKDIPEEKKARCSQCGEVLVIGHFAYEWRWEEFWCENCIRAKLKSLEEDHIACEIYRRDEIKIGGTE